MWIVVAKIIAFHRWRVRLSVSEQAFGSVKEKQRSIQIADLLKTNKSYILKVFIALKRKMNFLWQSRQKRTSGSKVKNVLLGTLLPHTDRLHRGFHLCFYRCSAKRISNTRAEKYSFLAKKNPENIAPQYVCLRPWCWFSSAATKHLSPCQPHKFLFFIYFSWSPWTYIWRVQSRGQRPNVCFVF